MTHNFYVSLHPLMLDFYFFFFNDTATTEIYTLSLHDALPICLDISGGGITFHARKYVYDANLLTLTGIHLAGVSSRSEEHTSELQSQSNLVCRLLLEKKKTKHYQLRA